MQAQPPRRTPAPRAAASPWESLPGRSQPPRGGSQKGLIIGLSVGGGVLLLLAVVLIVVLALRSSPESRIIGRWEVIAPPGQFGPGFERRRIEFRRDGTVLVFIIDMQKTGRYRFLDQHTLEVTEEGGRTETLSVAFDRDELIITTRGARPETTRLKRID
jgi:hypothetical protein